MLSVLRHRTLSTLLLLALIATALLSVPALASAAPTPYPPSNPSSGVAPGTSGQGAVTTNQSNTQSNETASTGFQTLTAVGIAVALLGGGTALVVAGRRRRRA
jgi:ABC-type antimicrobial peptide transport system permease subunit